MDFAAFLAAQPSDQRTSARLANASTMDELSPGALADYGFDTTVYILAQQRPPTEEQFHALWNKYQELILEKGKPLFIETLHNNIKNLRDILGEDFQWVCNLSNLHS